MRTLFIGALLASAVATPAFAQEKAPFTGPHVEAILGYDRVNAGDDFDGGRDGLLYGGALGYDFQVGGIVLGAEGEITGSTTRSRGSDLVTVGDRYTARAGRDLYAGGRIGFVASPSTMIYAKGGYTNARFDVGFTPAGGTFSGTSFNADGYRVGAGVEQKFNIFGPSGFIKAEYRYSNYSKVNSGVIGSTDIDTDRHQAVIGVGVRF
jgi:outer membrane immunogenic protein